MAKSVKSKKTSKKELRKLLFEKLSGAMAEYKDSLKEKKLVNNLKKISKLFAEDIAKAPKQNGKLKERKKKAEAEKTPEAKEPSIS